METEEYETKMAGRTSTNSDKLEGLLEGLSKDIQALNKHLLGNGQPGVLERTTRMEENLEEVVGAMKSCKENLEKIAEQVSATSKALETHINDNDKHSWRILLRRDVLAIIIVGALTLHSLIPADLSIFNLIKGIFGL